MNRKRDSKNERKLRTLEWSVMTAWERQLRGFVRLNKRIIRFLG
jgi:G:T-mismatch repair DNA endonuclease (very short patch repair protein)